jgi:hypothetical protein
VWIAIRGYSMNLCEYRLWSKLVEKYNVICSALDLMIVDFNEVGI